MGPTLFDGVEIDTGLTGGVPVERRLGEGFPEENVMKDRGDDVLALFGSRVTRVVSI